MKISLQLTIESLEDVYAAFDALCAAESMFINEEQPIQEEQPIPQEESEKKGHGGGRPSGLPQTEEVKEKIGLKIAGRLWYNDGKVNVRRYEKPGPQWYKGQLRHN